MSRGRFYVVRTITGVEKARFGPWNGPERVALLHNLEALPLRNTRLRNGMLLDQCWGRATRFPGVVAIERPARARIDFPAAAAITDHSTLQFVDPNPANAAKYVFEFRKAGAITPGNVEVDISAAVTGADVAAAFVAALVAYNGTAPVVTPSGFLGEQVGATSVADFLQAFYRKNQATDASSRALRGTWFVKTWGSFGNTAIVLSVAAEWTNRIQGFAGGKHRDAGVFAIPEQGGKPWAQAVPGWVPALVPPVEIG